MITFYDVPSKAPTKAWSPVNWKIRLVLNYKKLPYKTEWIEYPDIEPFCKKQGIQPTETRPDGTPYYTLPAIYDSTTGIYVADSVPIVQYLDKTYPDTPQVIPSGTEALVYVFIRAFFMELSPMVAMMLPKAPAILNSASAEYYSRTKAIPFGKLLAEIAPTGEDLNQALEKLKDGFAEVCAWYEKSTGKFIMGDQPTYGDFVLAGILVGVRTLSGEESDIWKVITGWQDRRWAKLLDDLKEYQVVV
ncbi:hypothetical protein BDQ17DRAFT_1284458 [Cyathus striatus]|nr:hypothetical protein BDQ17DRAFT_1284458 [Cyathus striatus]